MSQIATAYAPDASALARAEARAAVDDRVGSLAVLRESELPALAWSGYAVVVLYEWLTERGLAPATNSVAPALQALLEPLICTDGAQAHALLTGLRAVSVGGSELAAYWTDWTGDESLQAAEFMAASRDWLISAAEAGTTAGALIILVR